VGQYPALEKGEEEDGGTPPTPPDLLRRRKQQKSGSLRKIWYNSIISEERMIQLCAFTYPAI